ncbi:1-(5-phosphoribosyl)-5-[(5-phosphoribosylamino)methylideneamino] imidazole-4-carboxamide isomerase [Rothia kristinae]|nr:1-(5-phosphoribosyl)-5-[(5-phosphoribosylamino)methylideneamino] imidazole-4-carboxamide isomerase [Rothia kristinae]
MSTTGSQPVKPTVTVLDYGAGNVRSAVRALETAGADVVLSRRPQDVLEADGLVVPGVGAFGAVMDGLRAVDAPRLIGRRVAGGRPVLGICVGLQVFFEAGTEHGEHTEGLGEWPGTVEKLPGDVVPHMGWNTVRPPEGSRLFAGIERERFYFVHSYAVQRWEFTQTSQHIRPPQVTWAEQGVPFIAAVENGPLSATQFTRRSPRTPGCGCCATGWTPCCAPAGWPRAAPSPRRTSQTRPGAGDRARRRRRGGRARMSPLTSGLLLMIFGAFLVGGGISFRRQKLPLIAQVVLWILARPSSPTASTSSPSTERRARPSRPRPRAPSATNRSTIPMSTPRLQLLPAVDVAGGQAVRLVQGEAGTETGYGDPVEAALAWQEAGAEWVHLVDLDAAFGRGENTEVLRRVAERVRLKIELSGGIRDDASLRRALSLEPARINLGTAALEDPEWTRRVIAEHGERIAVGLDVRGTTLAARGWTEEGGDLWEVLDRLNADGCARYVVTDVTKDGTLRGPNTELLAEVARRTDRPVVASGGISGLADLEALRAMVPHGVEGAIVGKALYAGRFTLAEALDAAGRPEA